MGKKFYLQRGHALRVVSSVLSQAKLVQFSCVCESLLSEPEVVVFVMVITPNDTAHSLLQTGP